MPLPCEELSQEQRNNHAIIEEFEFDEIDELSEIYYPSQLIEISQGGKTLESSRIQKNDRNETETSAIFDFCLVSVEKDAEILEKVYRVKKIYKSLLNEEFNDSIFGEVYRF